EDISSYDYILVHFIFLYRSVHHPDLHSFPTRRSSDLVQCSGEEQIGYCRAQCETHALHGEPAGSRHPRQKPERNPEAEQQQQWRSEEHTSELQSLRHLVCRLLLEKKK